MFENDVSVTVSLKILLQAVNVMRIHHDMEDFEEIAHTGGMIQIRRDGVMSIRHVTAKAAAWFQLCVSMNGIPWGYIPMGGLGSPEPRLPTGSIPVFIGSDEEGYFGRQCPACNEYFRTRSAPDPGVCPYCCITAPNTAFTTPAQKQFIVEYLKVAREVIEHEEDRTINIDELLRQVSENRSPFAYPEKRQQTHIKCSGCKAESDIFGVYGQCHACGRRNAHDVLQKALSEYRERIEHPRYDTDERSKREREWRDIIVGCVAEFDSFGNDLKDQILQFPLHPRRRKRLKEIGFQSPLCAAELLKNLVEVDLLNGVSEDDKAFINKQFNCRHIFEHKGGVVDQEYIDRTADSTRRVGEKVRVTSSNAKHMIELIAKMAQNFFNDYEAMLTASDV